MTENISPFTEQEIRNAVEMIKSRAIHEKYVFKLVLPRKTIIINATPEEAYSILKKAWCKEDA